MVSPRRVRAPESQIRSCRRGAGEKRREPFAGQGSAAPGSALCRSRRGLCTQDLKDVTNFNEAKGNPGQCWMLYCGLFFSRYSLFHCFKLAGAGSPGGDVTA